MSLQRKKKSILIIAVVISAYVAISSSIAQEPNSIPWPVGDSSGMHQSRDIMKSLGCINGDWSSGGFHPGIDILYNTGSTEVRCVKSGWIVYYSDDGPDHNQMVIVCDDTTTSQYGWAYEHLTGVEISQELPIPISYGDLIGHMDSALIIQHLHFMWADKDYPNPVTSYANPLNYLTPAPTAAAGYTWTWNPDGFDPPFEYFFLPNIMCGYWDTLSVAETNYLMLDTLDLSGAVDLFFGSYHSGIGMASGPDQFNWVSPRRIEWNVVREAPSGEDTVLVKYVRDFNCEIEGFGDSRFRMHYFSNYMNQMFGHYGSLCCLTNCGDMQGWEGLGIENIEENRWQTDYDANELYDIENPVLAAYPDGPYQVNILSYPYDTTVVFPESIYIELHNFSPVVEEVVITCDGRTIWQAFWTADGLMPEWHNPVDLAVLPDQTLDVTVVFSEPMDTTSVTVTAGVSSPYNDITASDAGLNWSWTNCPEEAQYKDTWHGVFNDLTGCTSGRMTLSIQAQDHDANGLMDPSIPVSDGRYKDTHHSFSVMGCQPGWPVTLHDDVKGSPVLADLDDDGDLDVVIQSTDGWVHVLADDGSSWNSHWPMRSGGWGSINVYSCPSIVDLDGDGDLDVLSVHAWGCHARDVLTGSSISGWPVEMGGSPAPGFYPSMSSPAIGDVDGDGHPEVVLCRHLSDTTILEPTVWLYEHTGWAYTWCRNLESGGSSVINTPAIGDVSSSHLGMEIVVCTAEGFQTTDEENEADSRDLNSAVYLLDPSDGENIVSPAYYNCWFYASPVVADIDDDGVNEIIVGTGYFGIDKWKVLVLNGNTLGEEHVWNVGSMVRSPVAVGDLNDDGILDVVAVDNSGKVNCWYWSGDEYQSLPGFPVTVEGTPAAPSIVDVDGDFELEIVVGTSSDSLSLYAINSDGSICSGYPVPCGNGVYGQVALGNIDDDDGLEMIFADDSDPVLYCYDLGAGSFPAMMPWRQFQHDSWHSGFYNADNTIPEPPTNLSGEITYTGTGCEVDLDWILSVNDPYSSSPEEPTDVIAYMIMRKFSSSLEFRRIQKVLAGTDSYTDIFSTSPMNSQVFYAVVALDGTNKSSYSNIIQFPTSPSGVISLGCSVIEEFNERIEPRRIDELSHDDRTSVHERTSETVPSVTHNVVASAGNPGCLTDGSKEICYAPSSGADAVVIDLGEECTVTSVLPERVSETSSNISILADESVRTDEAVLVVEPSLIIEVAGSDGEFYPFTTESLNITETVRYVRIRGASGLSEISVYGERASEKTVSSVAITRNVEDAGWMFAIPAVEYSEEAEIKIFDVSGRMIWSGHAESGSILHWDGYTDDRTPVPNGVYLLHCSIGSEVSTGSFVVMRD